MRGQNTITTGVSRREFLKLGGAGLAGAALLGVAGCGSGSGGGAGEQSLIGFSQATMNHPYRVAMVEGNKKYAQKNLSNVRLVVTDGQDNASKQVSDVDSLLAQGVKALILSPVTEDALTPAVRGAEEQGTPVITLDRRVNTPVTMHIGASNEEIGKKAAEFLAEKLGGEGKIIEIQGTAGASATIERHDGFKQTVDAEYPGLEIVATQYADFLRAPARSYMDDQLQRFGSDDIQAVYAHNDEMALGAVQALEEAGRSEGVAVLGIDGQNNAIQAVKDGQMIATFIYPTCAPEAIVNAAKVARGEKVPKNLVLEGPRVDASNVEKWLGKGLQV